MWQTLHRSIKKSVVRNAKIDSFVGRRKKKLKNQKKLQQSMTVS